MAAYTLEALEGDIRSYTEVDSNVLTGAILGRFIENAENRILYDLPMDSDRKMSTGNFALDNNTINKLAPQHLADNILWCIEQPVHIQTMRISA